MDNKIVADSILNKRPLEHSDVESFKMLAIKYPYAQLFSILYLKALAQTNTFLFEEELNKHAYKITDRVKLYEIIHSKDIEETFVEPEATIEKKEITTNSVKKEDASIEISSAETVEENTVAEIAVTEETEETLPIKISAEEITIEVENKTALEIEEVSNEEEVEEKAVEAKEEKIEEQITDEKTLEVDILSSAMEVVYPYILEKEIAVPSEKQETEKIEELITISESEEELPKMNSFSGWLSASKPQEKLKSISVDVEKQVEENKKETIIDKFIEKNPSISRPKKEFFSASKKAQESVDESSLLYSETLANIFVLQGNLPLAIKAYEQLCLTLPEKRAIFAKKIEELNKRINNLK